MAANSMMTSIIIVVLSLSVASLTVVPSAAQSGCHGYHSVSDVLKHYDLPPGLFPDTVKEFKCEPVSHNKDALSLKIQLEGECKVTRELVGVGNMVTCHPQISGIISYRQITHVNGVTVTLTFRGHPVGDLMTITQAKVVHTGFGNFLEFNSDKGTSPWFPVDLIQKPPKCDHSTESEFESESGSTSEVVAQSNKEVTPVWVYKYGRLLPIIVAA